MLLAAEKFSEEKQVEKIDYTDKVIELDKSDGYITVKFEIREKRFQFPQVFEKGFLII